MIVVRRIDANVEDLAALFSMMVECHREIDSPHPIMDEEEIKEKLKDIAETAYLSDSIYLIAGRDGDPAGYLLGNTSPNLVGKPRKVGFIEHLYVKPEHRGSKVGLELVRTAISIMAGAGAKRLECAAVPGFTERAWSRLGLKPYAIHMYGEMADIVSLMGKADDILTEGEGRE